MESQIFLSKRNILIIINEYQGSIFGKIFSGTSIYSGC